MLMHKSKQLAKRMVHQFGYNLVKLPSGNAIQSYPYVRTFEMAGERFDFWIGNEQGRFWYDREGMAEGCEAKALVDLVAKGDRVLEVGCHHGFFTSLLGKAVGPNGAVVAVEAEATNAMIAQSQMMLNRLGKTCVVMHRAGSDVAGMVDMSTTDGTNSYVTDAEEAGQMSVQAVTGDDLAAEFGPFDVVKVDVEGFEGKVLAGCEKVLAQRPKLALELHLEMMGRYGTEVSDIFEMIGVEGYDGCMMVWPDDRTLVPFDAYDIPAKPTINVFLRPRR